MIWWLGFYSEMVHGLFALLCFLVLLRRILGIVSTYSHQAKWLGVSFTILLAFSLGYLSHQFLDWVQFIFGKDWV
jgi:hypothetical protein